MLKLLALGGRSARLVAAAEAAELLPDGLGMNHGKQKTAPLRQPTNYLEKNHFKRDIR